MKKNNSLSILLVLTTLFASCKKEINKTVTVQRDCTGTYLCLKGKDYQVCNLEKVSAFPNGATATATFRKIKNCNGSGKDAIVCYMFHANEGWIEVDKIQ